MTHDDLVDFRTTVDKESLNKFMDAVMKHKREIWMMKTHLQRWFGTK